MTPDEHTIKEHTITTSDGLHRLYVHEWGNPKGTTMLFLHGGPGSGCNDSHKDSFDPSKHRAVFVDQRGSGRSEPFASTESNTTKHLVEDLEQIRQKLKIHSWIIVGGSWGSTLALCYAIRFPETVQKMILRGIFLGSQEELDWFYGHGTKDFFPEVWQRLLSRTPPKHQNDPQTYHFGRIANPANKSEYKESAYAIYALDMVLMKLDTRLKEEPYEEFEVDKVTVNLSYFIDNRQCYLPDDYILGNAPKLTMPITIIQGRYDMVCRPAIAYKLHQALPSSKLVMTLAGHSGSDRSTLDASTGVSSQL